MKPGVVGRAVITACGREAAYSEGDTSLIFILSRNPGPSGLHSETLSQNNKCKRWKNTMDRNSSVSVCKRKVDIVLAQGLQVCANKFACIYLMLRMNTIEISFSLCAASMLSWLYLWIRMVRIYLCFWRWHTKAVEEVCFLSLWGGGGLASQPLSLVAFQEPYAH